MLINGRDRIELVDALERQIAVVERALAELGVENLSVRGALCFPNIDGLPVLRPLRVRSGVVTIAGPRGVAKLAGRPGPLTRELVEQLAQQLARRFPAA